MLPKASTLDDFADCVMTQSRNLPREQLTDCGPDRQHIVDVLLKPRAEVRFQIVCTADIRLQIAMWQIAVALQTGQIAKETRADCRVQIAKSIADCS